MTESADTNWGCAAVGRSGDVSIDVDEAISAPDRWQIEIELSRFCLRFAIPTPSVVTQLCDFLECHLNQTTTDELRLGTLSNADVCIIKDDEFVDRFFLRVSADDGAVHHTLTGDVVSNLIAALKQAKSDLDG